MNATPDYPNQFRLDGLGFLILGAGQGIGAACARALSSLGAQVLCVDRDPELARSIAEDVGGGWHSVDVTDEESVIDLMSVAASRLDRLYGAVDIVGAALRRPIPELDSVSWDQEFNINLRHAYLLGRHLGPRLADQGGGSLVFIASTVSTYGCHLTPAYHASKAALVSWVKSLAVTFGPSGVRVNAVSPGAVVTPRMSSHWEAPGMLEAVQARTALKRLADPSDIACAVAFLSSPAASLITGHELVVDGGTRVRDPYYGDSLDESLV